LASAQARNYDLVIVTPEAAEKLKLDAKRSRASASASRCTRARRCPNISTPEALKKTLLAAKSVGLHQPGNGTSGKYVVEMFRKLNILEDMKSKTTLVDSGYAVAPVGEGKVELGIHQISEILPVKGVKPGRPLPAEFQRYTVYAGAWRPARQKAARGPAILTVPVLAGGPRRPRKSGLQRT